MILIRLRGKYRKSPTVKNVRPKGDGDGKLGTGKKRHKLTDAQRRGLPPKRQMVMQYDALRGRGLMIEIK